MDAPVAIRSALLEHVDPADVRSLVSRARPRMFQRGQVVFQRGDEADGLYVVVSGEFRVLLEGVKGKEYTLSVIGPGDVLGDLPLLDGMGRTATAIASTPVQSLFVSAQDFDAWLIRNPQALRAIAVGLARRLRANMEQVAEMGLFDVGARVQRHLWRLFTGAAAGGDPRAGLKVRLNQGEAASSIGAPPGRASIRRCAGCASKASSPWRSVRSGSSIRTSCAGCSTRYSVWSRSDGAACAIQQPTSDQVFLCSDRFCPPSDQIIFVKGGFL